MCKQFPSSSVSRQRAAPIARPQSSRGKWMIQSIVKRTRPKVKSYMESLISSTPFLRQQAVQEVALLHRSEVQVSEAPIGTGGFSKVYAVTAIVLDSEISARCTTDQERRRQSLVESVRTGRRQYAIKVLKARLLQYPKQFTRAAYDIVSEAQYLERLRHPNVIQLAGLPINGTDAWSTGNHDDYFLLMERLECTVSDRIKEWKLKPECTPDESAQLAYILEAAEGLQYLHRHRIVFRDLKPANLGITHSGHVVLFDFGLCRQLPTDQESLDDLYKMSGVGTRRYMAPEVIIGSRYNQQADVYSLAMVSWEILTGVRPFLRYGIEEHRQAICFGHDRPRILPKWSESTAGFLENSWCSDPILRWDVDMLVSKLEIRLHAAPTPPLLVAANSAVLPHLRSKSLNPIASHGLISVLIRSEDESDSSRS